MISAVIVIVAGTTAGTTTTNESNNDKNKIGFENLAKIVGRRWQELGPADVVFYKEKAGEDMLRYKQEMEVYLAKQKEQAKDEAGDDNDEDASSTSVAAKLSADDDDGGDIDNNNNDDDDKVGAADCSIETEGNAAKKAKPNN